MHGPVMEAIDCYRVIEDILVFHDWTIKDFAKELGTAPPNVSRWRNGAVVPSKALQKVLLGYHAATRGLTGHARAA